MPACACSACSAPRATCAARSSARTSTLARSRLGALCSRDPSTLDAVGLANGTIASLAENLTDAVVAPLCALLLFGVEGALAYRAINTLDAMIGYRGRYEWLGKAAARLDDVVNLVPARLAALAARSSRARACRHGVARARRRASGGATGGSTPSPNGGHPMAMTAGSARRSDRQACELRPRPRARRCPSRATSSGRSRWFGARACSRSRWRCSGVARLGLGGSGGFDAGH